MPSGRDAERELAATYDVAGFETYLPPQAKYREQDVWGLFDILAFDGERFEFVQVKSGRDAAGIVDWFADARAYEAAIDGLTVTFAHKKAGSWRIARTTDTSFEWVFDGRDQGFSLSERPAAVLPE